MRLPAPVVLPVLWIAAMAGPAMGQGENRSKLLSRWFRLPTEPYVYTQTAAPRGLEVALLSPKSVRLQNPITNDGATLGRVLFYDRRLSKNERTSCASCHVQIRAFADFRKKSVGLHGRTTTRNTLGLTNLQFHRSRRFFWDERAPSLEETVLLPIQNPIEMHMNLNVLVARIRRDTGYLDLFRRAFGSPKVTTERIAKALAQFVRSMASFQSRFDIGYAQAKSFRDDFTNFSKRENRGKRLFAEGCASCHMRETRVGDRRAPVLFQGDRPTNNGLDRGLRKEDAGVGRVSNTPEDRGRFRAPSLRNVALTAPYMHDGRFSSLDDVVRFYAQGVRNHPNLDPRMVRRPTGTMSGAGRRCETPTTGWGVAPQTQRRDEVLGFPMTKRDRQAIVAFLRTLTDQNFVRDVRFSDPWKARNAR